jgi:hypothetical protein
MRGVKRGVTLVTVVIALLGAWVGAAAQVATTTIQDTVYRADGTPAGGTVLVSWQTFTTAAGQAVAAGNTSATIGANGALSLALTPNAGAMPTGSYYTAVLHLDDGTTSQQYWVVPVSATPVTLATIENQVLPASVAMQTASRAYVDAKVAQVTTGGTTGTTEYVPITGGTMTGPLVLPGDPVTPTQAADKHYVDTNITQVIAGVGQKVSLVPSGAQTVQQPAGTQLGVNVLNGTLYASQFQTGDGGNGIANALSGCGTTSGCLVTIDSSYTASEPLQGQPIPATGHVVDLRGGADSETFVDPVNPQPGSVAESLNLVTTRSDANSAAAGSGVGTTRLALSVSNTALMGGSNQLPGNIENPPYGKANYGVELDTGNYFTEGQHVQDEHVTNCYAVGDCLDGSWVLTSSGGYRDMADEGAHPFDLQVSEDYRVFQGTCSSGCTSGSTSVFVNATGAGGTQGEGRFLIDKNPAKTISTGKIVSSAWTVLPEVSFSGTSFSVSVFLQTAASATSQPKNIAPGTVTLPIVTSGAPAGFAENTSQIPSSGVACIADTNDGRFPNFETANYTVADASHLTLTLNKVHASNAVIAVGGLCGYGIEQTVDTMGAVRQVFPVIGSLSATSLFYAAASTNVVGSDTQSSTSGYQNVSVQIASIARQNNVVTVTLSGNTPFDVNGLTMTVSGVADASYNGSFQVTTTGSNQLTYNDSGTNSTSTGGTISFLNGGFVLYPMAEVLNVFDTNARQVDGQFTLAANTVAWAAGDAVEEPHYYQQLTAADTEWVTQYVPRPVQYSSAGKQYMGQVGPGMRGWEIFNGVSPSNYVGGGGTHQLPDDAYVVAGPWNNDFEVDAGAGAVIRAHCNLHGCNRWDSGYSLFSLDSASGQDFLYYSPTSSTATWILGGQSFGFSPSGFTAKAITATTLNATTLAASALTSGYQGRAQLAAGGSSGYSNFTLNGNNADGSRIGFIGGGGSDQNLYLDVPAGGGFDFRVNNVHTITFTGDSGGTVQTSVVQTQQVTGTGSTPNVTAGSAAGGGSASASGNTLAGVLSVTTGSSPSSSAVLATVSWSLPSGTPPRGCSLMPRNAAAAAATGTIFTGAPSTSGWTVNVGASALTASTSYSWSYQCF